MEFHPEKCEVITITRKPNPVVFNYTMHGHKLQHVDSIKYLGLTIARRIFSGINILTVLLPKQIVLLDFSEGI